MLSLLSISFHSTLWANLVFVGQTEPKILGLVVPMSSMSYLVEVDSEAGGSEEQHRRHARGPRHQPSYTEGNDGQWEIWCDAHLAPHTVPHLGDHHLEEYEKCSDNTWDIMEVCIHLTFGTAPVFDEELPAALPRISWRLDMLDSGAQIRYYCVIWRTG